GRIQDFNGPGATGGDELRPVVREWDGHKKFNGLNDINYAIVPEVSHNIFTVSLGMGKTDGNLFMLYAEDQDEDGITESIKVSKWSKDLDSSKWIQIEGTLSTAPPALPNIGYTFPANKTEEYYCNFDSAYSGAKPICSSPPFNMLPINLSSRTECKQASNDLNKDTEIISTENVDRAYCKLRGEPITANIPSTTKEGEYYLSMVLGTRDFPENQINIISNPYLEIRVWGNGGTTSISTYDAVSLIIPGQWTKTSMPSELKVKVPQNAFISFNGKPIDLTGDSFDENIFLDRFRLDETSQGFEEADPNIFQLIALYYINSNSTIAVGQELTLSDVLKQHYFPQFTVYF
ncbi:MAG: hypothetical protein Q7R33_08455, partial [Nitrosarchaeum sp.]|nr:hypothetical protein [Nitrosarchaeum sp.]